MKKILFISPTWPVGGYFGGQLRALHTASALQELGSVSVVVASTDVRDAESRQRSEEAFQLHEPVQPQVTPNQTLAQKLRWAFDSRCMNVHGMSASPADKERIVQLIGGHDLVWVLNSRTPNILQQWSWRNGHLDIDDVPSTYHRALARDGSTIRERWKARLLEPLIKRRELLLKSRFATLSVCSEEDRRYLGGGDQIHVIPNGFQRPVDEPIRVPSFNPPRIGFIGLYTYEPNRDGVRWFLKNCWPAIREALPGVRFRVIGKGGDGEDGPKGRDIDALGWVADPAEEIATWSAMVIPIRLGAGTRIKIADAFSRKCPVVSTSFGAFGYGAEDGKQLRLADTPDRFAAACVESILNKVEAEAMAERAWAEFLEKWTWDAITPRIWAAAEDCLRRGNRSADCLE